jgi:hypothetical protein
MYLPPREHGPAYVHVWKDGTEVVIDLATAGRPQKIRAIFRMRTADTQTAFWIVEEHTEHLLTCWRKCHG